MQIDHSKLAFEISHIILASGDWGRFKQSLNNIIEERVNKEVKDNFDSFHKCFDKFQKRIESLLQEKDPSLLISITKELDNLKIGVNEFKTIEKGIDKKLKKLVDSSSLYEDVYKMRDEMKAFKKDFESFSEKMKKLFK